MKELLLGLGLLAALATPSDAANVTFTSSGAFSNIQNCSGCSLSGGGTVLDMSGGDIFGNPSTLTAIPGAGTNIPVPPSQANVLIGAILWDNNATFFTDVNFNVLYTLTVNMTSPIGQSDSAALALNIQQPTNPPGDHVIGLNNAALQAGLNFGLPGVTVANLHFGLDTTAGHGGTWDGNNWYNPEHSLTYAGVSQMNIYADFNQANPNVGGVPEPTTWAMMFLGFAGIGLYGMRRRRNGERSLRLA